MNKAETRGKVLDGLKVVEFAALGPVPWCGMVLADLGADIIRVERPGSEQERDTHGALLRGRVRVQLDLKSPAGRDAAMQIVERADVLLEGSRPGVMERLGLGPDECMARNPRLVYGRMTGWGQTGPLAHQAGHDINYIALSGALHAIGPADHPVPPLNLVGDFGGGGALLAIGVLGALLQARSTGHGQVVDAAMVDGTALLMALVFSRLQMGQWRDQRASNPLDGGVPWYDTYRTSDDRFIAVGALEAQFYQQLLEGLGLVGKVPDRQDPSSWSEIRRSLTDAFASRTRDEWAEHFSRFDACVTPVLSMTEAVDHPHMKARKIFVPWRAGQVPGAAPVFDGVRPSAPKPSVPIALEDALSNWSDEVRD